MAIVKQRITPKDAFDIVQLNNMNVNRKIKKFYF